MADTIKNAISIRKTFFEQAENLAYELNNSCSHLFGLAIEDYVKNYQNHDLLNKINAIYAEKPEIQESIFRANIRKSLRRILDGE
ncbi:MAG: hypothetical protein WCP19_03500 [Chloroflexota bacterium]